VAATPLDGAKLPGEYGTPCVTRHCSNKHWSRTSLKNLPPCHLCLAPVDRDGGEYYEPPIFGVHNQTKFIFPLISGACGNALVGFAETPDKDSLAGVTLLGG